MDEWSAPLIGRYRTEDFVFRLTIPYVRVTAPSDTVLVEPGTICTDTGGGSGTDCQIAAGSNSTARARATQSGLGDVVAQVTYEVPEFSKGGPLIDLTGKIKFGTADEAKGLGTGKNTYTL